MADLHPVVLEHPGELLDGELAPLLGVEHPQDRPRQYFVQGVDVEVCLQSLPLATIGGVLESRQATTYRLYQSMMATR